MYVDPATVETVTEIPTAVAAPEVTPAMPDALRVLARDARDEDDRLARRSLAVALLGRGWTSTTAGAASGLGESEVSALGRVRRPGSAAASVADDLVSARLGARAS